MMLSITEDISYIPATENPLSADVGIIRTAGGLWIYDVGAAPAAAAAVNALPGPKRVVLSHFHKDHAENIDKVAWDELYAGGYTCKKLGYGTEVAGEMAFPDGVRLFPLPSSHARGCVGLEVGDYAFVGDGTYKFPKDGEPAFNAGLLQALIKTLKSLRASWLLLSHSDPFAHPREQVIGKLEAIYAKRDKNNPYIFLP